MSFSGREYADRVRALRDAGYDFPANRGYVLRDAANWSSGLKSAVTRAFNSLEDFAEEEAEFFGDDESLEGFSFDDREAFYDDAAGDNFEGWDDIAYFDYDETDDFGDEEADSYSED